VGLIVNRLIRISFGPFRLGDLPEGAVEEVRARMLRDQLGAEFAAAEAPLKTAQRVRSRTADPAPEGPARPPRPPRPSRPRPTGR
jgi:23S rRNA pseudouridine2605 synthase